MDDTPEVRKSKEEKGRIESKLNYYFSKFLIYIFLIILWKYYEFMVSYK